MAKDSSGGYSSGKFSLLMGGYYVSARLKSWHNRE